MTSKTLTVRTIEQAALWLELDGQISDGYWENARPYDHWKVWCEAEVVVGEGVGRNFYATKSNYDFSAKELLDVVQLRMLGIARIARNCGLEMAEVLEHAVDCETGTIDWSSPWNQDNAIKIANADGINSIEVKNTIDAALANTSYTLSDMRRDLNDLKAIIKINNQKQAVR